MVCWRSSYPAGLSASEKFPGRPIILHQRFKSMLGGPPPPNLSIFSPQQRSHVDPRHSLTAVQALPCGKGYSVRESISLRLLHVDLKVNLRIFLHHPIMPGPTESTTQASSSSFIHLNVFSLSDHCCDVLKIVPLLFSSISLFTNHLLHDARLVGNVLVS